MLNSVQRKITIAFIIVTTVSMLAMLFIVGYGSAKIILDRITLDNDIFVNQMTRSIEAIGPEDEAKVLEYVKESANSEVIQVLKGSSKREYSSYDDSFTITVPVKKD